MITHVKIVTVFVRNQEEALRFYTEKLGFEVRRNEPMGPKARWIEVAPRGGQTTCVLFTPPGMEDRIGGSHMVVFNADDCQKTYEELSARGVNFVEKPTRQPWGGVQAQFVDQDGNQFVLVSER